MDAAKCIESGKSILGIEFGSTRIKAVLIDEDHNPIAEGGHEWENRFENGVWTYSLDDIWTGLKDCYANLKKDVKAKYGVGIKKFASRSDKRFTLQIFLFAGTFAYEHDFGRGISDAENQFVTHCAERTVSTLTALLFKFVPIDHEGHLNR